MTSIDQALEFTGFGLYSIFMLILCFIIISFKYNCISIVSFILPYAICELEIDSYLQGATNASFWFGDSFFSFFWAIASDLFGRKQILIIIVSVSTVTSLLVAFAPTGVALVISNFVIGIVSGNLLSISIVIVCEFHKERYRESLTIFTGFCFSLSIILLSGAAMGIIPLTFKHPMGIITFSSWRFFILFMLIVPGLLSIFLSVISFESPKYLLYKVSPEKSLETLKKLYAWNKRKDPDSFPVTALEFDDEIQLLQKDNSFKSKMILFLSFFTSLFDKSLLKQVLALTYFFTIDGILLSVNSWSPQYYALYSGYGTHFDEPSEAMFCNVILQMKSTTDFDPDGPACNQKELNIDRFWMTIYYGFGTAFVTLIASIITNKISNIIILFVGFSVQTLAAILLICVSYSVIALNILNIMQFANFYVLLSLASDLFPTAIRAFGLCYLTCVSGIFAGIASIILPSLLIITCDGVLYFLIVITISQTVVMFLSRHYFKKSETNNM